MADYTNIQKEETLKSLVHEDFFSKFGYEPNIDNIDFVITDKKARNDLFSDGPGSSRHYLWAEAKKGMHDIFDMFTQLVLTCKKTYEKADHLAPPWLGVFDEARISFVAFHDILPIFSVTDFNWNITPSNHETEDFQKAKEKVKALIGAKSVIYHFETDDRDIKEFIKNHITTDGVTSIKSPITKDNFVQIFIKWVKEVKPYINIPKDEWMDFKQKGILDCDFYRADIMSLDGNSITEKLKIVLKNDNYKFQENIAGRLFTSDIGFTDNGEAYSRFWNKYERPPAPVYQQYIIDRRDLLVPQNIREVKGSFFTPKIWADKSKEYIAAVFGDNWQDEYYIWDCAAGTGNLLAGLTNKYNLWASDIEQGNVETMQSLIDIDDNLNLLSSHIFQFDFLNDSFDNLPQGLLEIINDAEKRKKLIIYINPPYAEAGNRETIVGKGSNKSKVSASKVYDEFKGKVGNAILELSAQFMLRIYRDIPDAKLATFCTIKYINSPNFFYFREYFKAEYKRGFVCKANTFDNVSGEFPIGFFIWDLENKQKISSVSTDIYIIDNANNTCHQSDTKCFYTANKGQLSIDWLRKCFDKDGKRIAYLRLHRNDIQNKRAVFITSKPSESDFIKHEAANVTEKNLIEMAIYCAIRQVIEATWLNNKDNFQFPNSKWETDTEFQNNCLVNVLFDNNIQSARGVNYWIPYTENEVNAKDKFQSNFMSNFLKGKAFSPEAQAVLDSGRELWKYYHSKIVNNRTASVDASFYDIREFFQKRSSKDRLNSKSNDDTYNALIKDLRQKLSALAEKIKPKVYEYGFLLE